MPTPSTYPLTSDDIKAEFGSDITTSADCLGLGSGVLGYPSAPETYPLTSADLLGIKAGVSASINVADKWRFDTSAGTKTLTMVADVSDGSGNFTYQWVKVSGSSLISMSSVTTSSTLNVFFTVTSGGAGTVSAVFRCDMMDVNDPSPQPVYSDSGTATFEFEVFGGFN